MIATVVAAAASAAAVVVVVVIVVVVVVHCGAKKLHRFIFAISLSNQAIF